MIAWADITIWQWLLVVASSLTLLWISPLAKDKNDFFKAQTSTGQPGMWLLAGSLVISWIFAKSITNAANLGLAYGIVGGVAYATYYLSFLLAGLIIFQLRTKGRFSSIHHFLKSKYGSSAIVLFSVLIAFRLFNEVWSNTMVIGSYFGETGSWPYYTSIIVFTILTLAYALKGGLRSSLFTDGIQMVLFGVLLLVILGVILPQSGGISPLISSGSWTLHGGLDLMLVAMIQAFSYPFHDPVMTDRGFITDPHTMRKAFLIAVPVGFAAIVFFSLIGVYADQQGLEGQAAVEAAKTLGALSMLAVNFIMITSASSTLDSAFASFSKLAVMDLKIARSTVSAGRLVMILLCVVGTIPIIFSPAILTATTISGTMVIGLAPIFLLWHMPVRKIGFVMTVLAGMCFGGVYAIGWYPKAWIWFEGDYGGLLSVNLMGTIACFLIFVLCRKRSPDKGRP